MKSFPKFGVAALAVGAMAFPAVTASSQTFFFDFTNNSGLDGAGVGDMVTFTNGDGDEIVVTVVGFEVPTIVDGAFSGTNGSAGFNIPGGGGLGINNLNFTQTPFASAGGDGTDSNDINFGESAIISFNQDVEFTQFDIQNGSGDDEGLEVLVDGVAQLSPALGTSGDVPIAGTGLEGLAITAGTEITIAAVGGVDDNVGLRVDEFTVNVVPEPASLALLGLGGLAICGRRRKQA